MMANRSITIEVVSNGFILTDQYNVSEVYLEVEPLFRRLLQSITGKAESFGQDSFGEVKVNFDENQRLTLTPYKLNHPYMGENRLELRT